MPDGRTHAASTIVLAASGAVIYYQAFGSALDAALLGIGITTGIALTPDLDMSDNPKNLWQALWWPYGKLFKHRGWSHVPVVGTITRVFYSLWWIPAVVMLHYELVQVQDVALLFAGLVISDILHAGLDWLF